MASASARGRYTSAPLRMRSSCARPRGPIGTRSGRGGRGARIGPHSGGRLERAAGAVRCSRLAGIGLLELQLGELPPRSDSGRIPAAAVTGGASSQLDHGPAYAASMRRGLVGDLPHARNPHDTYARASRGWSCRSGVLASPAERAATTSSARRSLGTSSERRIRPPTDDRYPGPMQARAPGGVERVAGEALSTAAATTASMQAVLLYVPPEEAGTRMPEEAKRKPVKGAA
jgi:hypothetical protein